MLLVVFRCVQMGHKFIVRFLKNAVCGNEKFSFYSSPLFFFPHDLQHPLPTKKKKEKINQQSGVLVQQPAGPI